MHNNSTTLAKNTIASTLSPGSKDQINLSLTDTKNILDVTPKTRPDNLTETTLYYRD